MYSLFNFVFMLLGKKWTKWRLPLTGQALYSKETGVVCIDLSRTKPLASSKE